MNKITITNERLAKTNDLYGIFFEDLNHAADGGLYAETIRNRSFEFSPTDRPMYNGLTAWTEHQPQNTRVSLSIQNTESASKANPHYLVMAIETKGEDTGVKNDGYNSGIPLYSGKKYDLNIRMKSAENAVVKASIISADGKIYDSAEFEVTKEWQDYSAVLTAVEDDFSASLLISMNKTGKVYLDFVSLFPQDTFKGRKNGVRRDLAELLEEMHPKFMRFPGGCLVHDGSLNKDDRDSCYRWKNTIGDVKERPSRRSNWRYNQSLGLGYYEYFILCEDLKTEPLPVLPAAYNPHTRQAVPFDELGEWIDDALDLIEFANGGENTVWGKKRCELGHNAPFNLKYIAIGNEEVGDGFFDRYDYFHKAIKEKYPDIKIINSAGPFCDGSEYDKGWASARKNGSDLIDEHYYMAPDWLLANVHRYDDFKENDTKVFLGEYASWDNMYYNALAEAAYMTGLENNAHAVALACYAPLFSNIQYTDWYPDMIWFDNHRVFASANYYTQKMFMTNQPTQLLKTDFLGFDKKTVVGNEKICGGIELISDNIEGEVYDIKITDNETGKIINIDNLYLGRKGVRELCNIKSGHYTIEMSIKRDCGELGFKLDFAKQDDKHKYTWCIGGWQNQDCLVEKQDGLSSCLTQNRFSLATGVEYKLKLVVDGRRITNYINGKKENDIVDNQLILDEIYYTAGVDDEKNEIVIKAVNVNGVATKGIIEVPWIDSIDGSTEILSGNSKEDKNSFENPTKILPVLGEIHSDSNSLEFIFSPMSVNVIRIKL